MDNNATTRIDPRVLESMMPFLTEVFGNAASNHSLGVEVNKAVKAGRSQVANLLKCEPSDIIFTSGATEAINLALKGITDNLDENRKHIVTCTTEHPAVLDTCKYLQSKGFIVTYLPVLPNGLIDLEQLKSVLNPDTLLVSMMYVNNETGVIQSIKEISELAHEKGAYFMTDATQAVGKIPIDVNELGIDLLSFSGHKFYGPKGIGGLFIRSRRPFRVKLAPLLQGGGHEKGLRSGTLNVAGIVGMGAAASIADASMNEDEKKISRLRNSLERSLLQINDSSLNGDEDNRIYNVTNICFKGVDADAIMIGLKDIMVSNGSACSSTKVEPSHVLKAMGRTDDEAYSSLRFSLGKYNTMREVDAVVHQTKEVVDGLKQLT